MEPLVFKDIAVLLNYSRTTHIDDKPISQSSGQWELYRGEHRIHTDRYPFEVLYLQSKATADGLKQAREQVFKPKHTHVVYAPSLDDRQKLHHTLFKETAKGFWTTKKYLESFFREELSAYNAKLSELAPKFYIDPDVEVPAGMNRKRPNPLLGFLEEKPTPGSEITQGELGVLLAEPGQGKTYMTQYLVSKMSGSKNYFPIYINSDQWRSIAPDDFSDISKTIVHSFRHLGAPIGWVDGCEDKFLEVTLKAGLFRVVFDGFDEYVLRNHGRISAHETLSSLARFAESTGARIVVTSRTSFWRSELENVSNTLHGTRLSVYTQAPFDAGQATAYFRTRLHDQKRAERAAQLYVELKKRDEEFVGRGFVINLLADLVIHQQDDTIPAIEGNPIEWLMYALCEREQLRQSLPLNPKEQLNAISLFVSESAQKAVPNSELLELAISIAAPHLGSDLRQDCINKMTSHPLVFRRAANIDNWEITQEQVHVALLAGHLMGLVCTTNNKELSQFAERAELEDSFASDIAEMIVDLASTKPELGSSSKQMKESIGLFLQAGAASADLAVRQNCLRRLAVMTALRALERSLPKGSSHKERSSLFLSLLPAGVLQHLDFSGAITRMDFRGVAFDKCRFEHVRWGNCHFDGTTIFQNCHFVGGSTAHCDGFGSAKWENLTADEAGHSFINAERIKEGNRKYTTDDLRSDIRAVLNKFIVRGGIAFRTVRSNNIQSGTVSISPHKDSIIDELTKRVIEEHEISGMSDKGYNIRDEAKDSMKFYAANNVFTGPIQETFQRLQKKLGL